jgi:serine protease
MKTLIDHPRPWFVGLLTLLSASLMCVCAGAAHAAADAPVPQAASAASAATPATTPARVIVKFKANSPLMRTLSVAARSSSPAGVAMQGPQHAQTLSARLGLKLTNGRVVGAHAQVLTAPNISSAALVQRLSTQSDVEYAVIDERKRAKAVVPNDPLYPSGQTSVTPVVGQWYLRPPTSGTIADVDSLVSSINAEGAWKITSGNPSVVVAVLDTGIRADHPDLSSKLLPGYDFIHDGGTAGDANGRDADPSDLGDFVAPSDVGVAPGCTYSDVSLSSSWHGTQTAGLAGAATNNGIGMAGAAAM